MSDQMLQPHYLKIYTRERGWVNLTDMRKPLGSETSLPRMFPDWFAANEEATKGIGQTHCCEIHPYYPEHAEGERLYVDRLIAAEKERFKRLADEHGEKLAALIEQRKRVPA